MSAGALFLRARVRVCVCVYVVARQALNDSKAELKRVRALFKDHKAWRYDNGQPLPNRNATCPCGKGAKFKKCHGK